MGDCDISRIPDTLKDTEELLACVLHGFCMCLAILSIYQNHMTMSVAIRSKVVLGYRRSGPKPRVPPPCSSRKKEKKLTLRDSHPTIIRNVVSSPTAVPQTAEITVLVSWLTSVSICVATSALVFPSFNLMNASSTAGAESAFVGSTEN